jgi:hypothetical protein
VSSSKGTQIQQQLSATPLPGRNFEGDLFALCRPRPYALKQHDQLGGFKTSLAKATCVIAESYIKITNWHKKSIGALIGGHGATRLTK